MHAALLHAASCSLQLPSRATDVVHVEPLLTLYDQAEVADVGPQLR